MKYLVLAGVVAVGACAGMTAGQKQAVITLAVQQGVTLASALGGHQAQQWVAAGGLICQVGNTYVAALGVNVAGTVASDMQAPCTGLGGDGAALPPGVDPASVLVAMLKH